MGKRIKVFVDSDVVIASIISKKGAGYQLIEDERVERWISTLSVKELGKVTKRMGLENKKLEERIKRCKKVELVKGEVGSGDWENYVYDPFDRHVLAGAVRAGVDFLITYNLKGFKKLKIKNRWGIICMEAGYFLQYLRETGGN